MRKQRLHGLAVLGLSLSTVACADGTSVVGARRGYQAPVDDAAADAAADVADSEPSDVAADVAADAPADVAADAPADVAADAPADVAADALADAASDAVADVAVDAAPPRPVAIDTLAPPRAAAGDVLDVSCALLDEAGATVPTPAGVTLTPAFNPPDAVRMTMGRFFAARAGEVAVTCSASRLMLVDATPARTQITAGPAVRMTTMLDQPMRVAGEAVTATCAAFDAFDNPVVDARPTLRLDPARAETAITGLSAVVTRAGTYRAFCDVPGAMGDGAVLTVAPALPTQLTLTRSPMVPSYEFNAPIAFEPTARDRYGNEVPSAVVELVSTPAGRIVDTRVFSYASEGPVTVTATVTSPTEGGRPVTAPTDFVVNAGGPTIRCDAPTHGGMINVAPGATVSFRGTVTDAQGVMALMVNDAPVTFDASGAFTTPVTARYGINAVALAATDALGVTRRRVCGFLASDRWTPEGATLANAVTLSLRPDGVDDGAPAAPVTSLGDTFRTLLASSLVRDQLHTALLAANPIKPLSCDSATPFGCAASTRVDYRNVTFRSPTVSSFTLVDGGLATRVTFNDVRLDVTVNGSVPLVSLPTPGTVTVATVQVDVIHDLGMVAGRPRATLRAGSTRTVVSGTTVDIPASGSLATLVSTRLQPVLDAAISAQVGSSVSTAVGDLMGGLFNSLDLSGASFSADVVRPDAQGTTPIRFDISFSDLRASASAFSLSLGTRFSTRVTRDTPAPFGIPLPPSTGAATLTAPATGFYDIGLYNQLFFTVWRGGLVDARLPVLGSSLDGPLASYAVLTPTLPFVMSAGSGGTLNLDVGFFDIDLVVPAVLPAPVHLTVAMRGSVSTSLVGQTVRFGTFTLDSFSFNTESGTLPPAIQASMREALSLAITGTLTNLFRNFPPFPIPAFTVPAAAGAFGLSVGTTLGLNATSLALENGRIVVRGPFGQR